MYQTETKVVSLKLITGENILGISFNIPGQIEGAVHLMHAMEIKENSTGHLILSQFFPHALNGITDIPYSTITIMEDTDPKWISYYSEYLKQYNITADKVKYSIQLLANHKFDSSHYYRSSAIN